MYKKLFFAAMVVASGTYFLASTPAQNQSQGGTHPQSWRHLALTSKGDDEQLAQQINQLGSDGWELVDVEGFHSGGETVKTVYYFKKPD